MYFDFLYGLKSISRGSSDCLKSVERKISVEIVFRSLYYVAKAIARGEKPDTVTYLAERAKLFGRVKAERKRYREKAALNQPIWEPAPFS